MDKVPNAQILAWSHIDIVAASIATLLEKNDLNQHRQLVYLAGMYLHFGVVGIYLMSIFFNNKILILLRSTFCQNLV